MKPERQPHDLVIASKENLLVTSTYLHRMISLACLICAAAMLSLVSTAAAAPLLELDVDRTPTALKRGDEFVRYEVRVSNQSPVTATCQPRNWTGSPSPDLSYQWLRDGVSLGSSSGAQTQTYSPQGADVGHSLQCQVTGTNTNNAVGAGTTTAGSTSVTGVSAASGTFAAGMTISGAGLPEGTRIIAVAGLSLTLSAQATSSAAGVALSATVTNSTTAVSAPIFYGSLPEVPPPAPNDPQTGSARPAVSGAGVNERACAPPTGWRGSPSFSFQWLRNGSPIPPANATASTTLGSNALTTVITATGSGTLIAGSKTITDLTSTTAFRIGQTIAGAGVPAGAKVVAAGPDALELSLAATESGAQDLTAGAQPVAVGEIISGTGIPAGTTVTAISGQTITMSATATATAASVAVTATATGAKYKPYAAAGEEDLNRVLQCQVIGSNAGGTAKGISVNSLVGPVTSPPVNNAANTPSTSGAEWTAGTITVAASFPAGMKMAGGSGWTCRPSSSSCTSAAGIGPGSTSILNVDAWIYAETAPDTVVAVFTAFGGGASDVSASDVFTFGGAEPFGFVAGSFSAGSEDEAGAPDPRAGAHPFKASSGFAFRTRNSSGGLSDPVPVEDVRDIVVDLPPGFVANPEATETGGCTVTRFKQRRVECPSSAAVGGVRIDVGAVWDTALYQVEPERGKPAEFAFKTDQNYFLIYPKLRSGGDYGITALSPLAPQSPLLYSVDVTLCNYGARSEIGPNVASFKGCKKPGDLNINSVPFLTNPTSCPGTEPTTLAHIDSWQSPGAQTASGLPDLSDPSWRTEEAKSPPVVGCDQLEFTPSVEAQPTTTSGDAPTGLDFNLHIPQDGLREHEKLAQPHLRVSTVTLPEGLTVNPASADGLGACSPAQIGLVSDTGQKPIRFSEDVPTCPDASKLGTVEVETPLLGEPLEGSVYLSRQTENPFGSLLALYIAVDDPESGIMVKLAGEVTPNKQTGQLTANFDENPQLPFENLALHFFSGPRAALRTPAVCGEYKTTTSLTPWSAPESGPAATPSDSFSIAGSCAPNTAAQPNAPSFSAGTLSARAGAYSPLVVRLARDDGSQELKGLDLTLPKGMTARLAGVAECSDVQIAQARRRNQLGQGVIEQRAPSCPAASEIGTVTVGAGAGPNPYYAKGHAYLAGPHRGAPLSMVIITPAVAGPFDLGVVAVQAALYLDPRTAQVTVKSDEIPTIIEGIPLDVRSIAVNIDRDRFTLNPTSCEEQLMVATAFGVSSQAQLSNRFQVDECAALDFQPGLKIQLHGGTKRSAYQRLEVTVSARAGDANIARAAVTLPHSNFLAQEHIRTVCTRVQFAADACPQGSIYGYATAITPLLDDALSGPVYLRSSDNTLPDLVAALRGPDHQPIEVELSGRTDSKNGGIRNTFDLVPDAPVSEFKLKLFGGKKSLIVNSQNLCGRKHRATVRFNAQNGKVRNFRPVVRNDCGKKKGKGKGKKSKSGGK